MATPIDPMAAVKLLRDALHWHHHIHNGTAPGTIGAALEATYRSSELFELTEAALAVEIEQPTSEAQLSALKDGYQSGTMVSDFHGPKVTLRYSTEMQAEAVLDLLADIIDAASSTTPPAKEAILQAMVDQVQELGLYDEELVGSRSFCAGRPEDMPKYVQPEPLQWDEKAGAPVDERAKPVWQIVAGLQGIAKHVRAVPQYRHLLGDMDIVDEAIAALQQPGLADGWISVEDRLPNKPGLYLVADDQLPLKIHYFTNQGKFYGNREFTHWMPLPNPPGAKK